LDESVDETVKKLQRQLEEADRPATKAENEAEAIRMRVQGFKGVNRIMGENRVDEPVIDPFKKEASRKQQA
jgi:hypothetical protein